MYSLQEPLEQYFVKTKNMDIWAATPLALMCIRYLSPEIINEILNDQQRITEADYETGEPLSILMEIKYPELTKETVDIFNHYRQPVNTVAKGPKEYSYILFGRHCRFSNKEEKADFVWVDTGNTVEKKESGARMGSLVNASRLCEETYKFGKDLNIQLNDKSFGAITNITPLLVKLLNDYGVLGIRSFFDCIYLASYGDDENRETVVSYVTKYWMNYPRPTRIKRNKTKDVIFIKENGQEKKLKYVYGEPWKYCVGLMQMFKYSKTESPYHIDLEDDDQKLLLNLRGKSIEEISNLIEGKIKFVGTISYNGTIDKTFQMELIKK